ncbi:protein phosphatase 2C domain-containing protein [Breoghania sp.]|uniref:PP2C family protein-serine/threonine phosphatase n=1 Tax=Breoghania sp. TaxID=2065378 RepID=UPI002AAC3B23|nr:protein phosphatase 2C domain-containing protein [Breoghania sp.]
MTLYWDCADIQVIGERKGQEDYSRFHVESDGALCILADGMGGHAAGDVAARLAVDTFLTTCLEVGFPWADHFLFALNEANKAIAAGVREEPARQGMGCTLVAVELRDGRLRWLSVGDSRLYLYRGGDLSRLNADHSMAGRLDALVATGEISVEQANADPSRNMLLSALTGEQIGLTDYNFRGRDVGAGDLVVLASDGLDTLDRAELHACLERYSGWRAEDIARGLVSCVIKRGRPRQDNTTALVVRVTSAIS